MRGLVGLRLLSLDRDDADGAAVRAVVGELDTSSDLCKQRVVLAEANVQPRTKPAAALTHENRAPGDEVAVEPLHSEALGIAVTTVTG